MELPQNNKIKVTHKGTRALRKLSHKPCSFHQALLPEEGGCHLFPKTTCAGVVCCLLD